MKLAAIVLLLAGTALAQRGPGGAHGGAIRSGGRSRFVAPPLVVASRARANSDRPVSGLLRLRILRILRLRSFGPGGGAIGAGL